MAVATGTLAPALPPQFFANDGTVAAGYKLFVYQAGTSTKATTYQDAGFVASNTNPIVLDAQGRASIYLAPGQSYKFVMALPTDTDPPGAPIWTRDNVYTVPYSAGVVDITDAVAGETLAYGNCVYLSDGTNGTTAGRWYKANATYAYSSSKAPQLGFARNAAGNVGVGGTLTVRTLGTVPDQSSLTPGLTYYVDALAAGTITSTAPANAAPVGVATSSTDLLMTQWTPAADFHTNADNGENLFKDAAFHIWAAGDSSAPTHWTLSGGTIARVAGSIEASAAQITPGGTARTLLQTVIPSAAFGTYYRSKTVAVTVWGTGGVAGAYQAYVDDGVTTGAGLANTTTGFEAVTYVHKLSATATYLKAGVNVTTNGTPTIHGMRIRFGSAPATVWKPSVSRRESKTLVVTGNATVATIQGKFQWYVPFPIEVLETILVAGTAPTGQAIIADTMKNGTTMYVTKPQIPATFASGTAVPDSATYSTKCLTRADILRFDVTQVGSGTVGADLTFQVVYRYYPNSFDEFCAVGDLA